MKKAYFMGIDVAKATLDFCLLSNNGARLWQGRLANESCRIKEFLAQLQAGGYKLSQIHFCCESTGVYGQRLVEALHSSSLRLSVVNPAQVRYFAISVLRRTKNDTVDSAILARYCRERNPLATRPLRAVEQELKCWSVSATAASASKTRTQSGPAGSFPDQTLRADQLPTSKAPGRAQKPNQSVRERYFRPHRGRPLLKGPEPAALLHPGYCTTDRR